MTTLAFQIVLILLVAYGLGCAVGCWARRALSGSDRELAADRPAAPKEKAGAADSRREP